ncbi:hypothetical protein MN1_730 [Thermus phage MN1]|nr:hypothetical protein MN1_730 [Thermus phage MN1]
MVRITPETGKALKEIRRAFLRSAQGGVPNYRAARAEAYKVLLREREWSPEEARLLVRFVNRLLGVE